MKTLLLIALIAATPVAAQQRTIKGTLLLPTGAKVGGANVFVLETLDGTISDSTGAFRLNTTGATGTLVIQRIGIRDTRVPLGAQDTITIVLVNDVIALPALNVTAGKFTTGNAPDAELNAIQVVSTPGASADVYRALQTFPGLQAVDQGAGLFVRGGDVAETRVFLNEAIVLSPYRYESPTGGFFGAFDPFLLDGIFFSSGGFGARYGDALSGVAALRTLGKPDQFSLGATASLAALSGTVSAPVGSQLGARATFTRSHTGLLFRVNGTNTRFTQEPNGRDASVTAGWKYRNGELKLFAIDQWSELGVFIDGPAYDGALDSDAVHDAQVLSWEHNLGNARLQLVAGNAGSDQALNFGALDLAVESRLRQLRGVAELRLSPWFGLNFGAELFGSRSSVEGKAPSNEHDPGLGAPTSGIDAGISDRHKAAFVEADWSPLDRIRAIVGLRADHARLTDQTTLDPRAALAIRVFDQAALTAAWGLYHQVPDPDLHDPEFGGEHLQSMRARHRILGAQFGEQEGGGFLARLELYDKDYRDLAAFDRDRNVRANGEGHSHGMDMFVRWPSWQGFSGRTSYSYIRARRTDPNTGEMARSPYDITRVITTIVDKSFGQSWRLSVARRYATGRPFTPVTAASFDAQRNVWVPVYGEPNSERLPAFSRLDLSFNRLVPLSRERLLVLFAAVNNLQDRKNVHDYRYNEDYSERTPVRSQFKRSVYFGASLTW